jgi:hypothetical protein
MVLGHGSRRRGEVHRGNEIHDAAFKKQGQELCCGPHRADVKDTKITRHIHARSAAVRAERLPRGSLLLQF